MLGRYLIGFLSVVSVAVGVFTPEDMLSGPRRTRPLLNKSGTLALYHESSYSFTEHHRNGTWNVIDLVTGEITVFDTDQNGIAIWLDTDDTSILRVKSTPENVSEFFVIEHFQKPKLLLAGGVDGPVGSIKAAATQDGGVSLVFSSRTYPNGTMFNYQKAKPSHTSGRVFESLYMRHWDKIVTEKPYSLFSIRMYGRDGIYRLSGPRNLLPAGLGLESPVQPFGNAEDFDISPDGREVAFLSKNPDLNPANNTHSMIYTVPHDASANPVPINLPDGWDIQGESLPRGASSHPKYSPDGRSIAYLQMYENGYESDQNHLFIHKVNRHSVHGDVARVDHSWDISPLTVRWTQDSRNILMTAEHYGRIKLFEVKLNTASVSIVSGTASVSACHDLPSDRLLLVLSSLVSSPRMFIMDRLNGRLKPLNPVPEAEESLTPLQIEEFSFPGADGVKVHGFITKPSHLQENRVAKYKMALVVHGGPQNAWNDMWYFSWNSAVLAEHGYVVVAVNPTGSTGYGRRFTDAIRGQWGGKPYVDLEKAIGYLQSTPKYQYIDFNRMVALGASYGGYMINYIQGMPLGRQFKALVCHDGVFSILNQIASDELFFPQHDFEGTLWNNRAGYER